MSRKVFISSDMSVDERLLDVAEQDSQAALMWPWFLTVFDDWGRAEAEPKRLKLSVFPGISSISYDDVDRALKLYHSAGLIQLYEVNGKHYMAIPTEKWYRYQTHMNRRDRRPGKDKLASSIPDPPRESPRGTVGDSGDPWFPIPSPSPSPSPSPKGTQDKEGTTGFADTEQQGQAGDNPSGVVLRDHTTYWRKPNEIPNEDAFRSLTVKEQLNLLVKEHRRRFPKQYKRYGAGGSVKTRQVFGESIAGGTDPWLLFIQIAFWDEEMDGVNPPPWQIVRTLEGCGPNQITEQYMRYTMDKQAAKEGVQVIGLSDTAQRTS